MAQEALANLAEQQRQIDEWVRLGEYPIAIMQAEELCTQLKKLGENNHDYSQAQKRLAELYEVVGNYEQAELTYRQILRMCLQQSPDHIDDAVAEALNNLNRVRSLLNLPAVAPSGDSRGELLGQEKRIRLAPELPPEEAEQAVRVQGPGVVPKEGERPPTTTRVMYPRYTKVRHYSRMNPGKCFRLQVIISRAQIIDRIEKNLAEINHPKLAISKDHAVEIEPVLPGCDCYPEREHLPVQKQPAEAIFQVVPWITGKINQGYVAIRQNGLLLAQVGLQFRVCKPTLAYVVAVIGGLVTLLSGLVNVLDFFGIITQDQLKAVVKENYFLFELGLIYWYVPVIVGGLLGFCIWYFWRKPVQAEPWEVKIIQPGEQLQQARDMLEGDAEQGLQLMRDVVQDHPEYPKGWISLGTYYYKQREYGKALSCFDKVLDLGADSARVLCATAQCAAQLHQFVKAKKYLQKAEEKSPGKLLLKIKYNLACYAVRLKQLDEAVSHLRDAFAQGFTDVQQCLKDPDLTQLKLRPDFQQLLRQQLQKQRSQNS